MIMPALTTGDTTSPSSLSNNAVFAQRGLESDMSAGSLVPVRKTKNDVLHSKEYRQ